MSARESFKQGRLAEAIAAQNEWLKGHPTDSDARFELFVFLCFAGDLERAEKQLDVLGSRDQLLERGSIVFRNLLASEVERRRVHEGRSRAVLPPNSGAHLALRAEALERLGGGDVAGAQSCIERAIADSPAVSGRIDG